ncbi:YceI family protein [Ornithobacterium rhinotracheale]|uniref:YceI family protein n=1 Tax=Ornithobacterium rhinotracheale TaxID=28251 RepID=UPI001FF4A5CE|nr:YceI family protein [Ornithobacterium rhinotracheale]MCK0202496.1 YceI family protein [Ornithobacterium rhinotracheale]
MKNLFKFSFAFVCLFFMMMSVKAQKIVSRDVNITITGTSTLHDWEMISDNGAFTANVGNSSINDVKFVFPVRSLKSGKAAMDQNAYNALNADKHKEIIFKALTIDTLSGNTTVNGSITINGVTKAISVPVKVYDTDRGFTITGYIMMKMTEYKVEPPVYMFGTIKTGDEIRIQFNISTEYMN